MSAKTKVSNVLILPLELLNRLAAIPLAEELGTERRAFNLPFK
jgi:hypothetical protein